MQYSSIISFVNLTSVIPLLEKLSTVLNDDVMRSLNYQVDEERKKPAEVAHEFLTANHLITTK